MDLVLSLLLLLASATAQMDPKALRPCFERYPNHRLVNLKPYHSEWRMRTEDACLLFCSDTRSRCRSIVYDSVQHICHFFLDDGNDFTIPAAKMIYLRVTNTDCLDPGHVSSSEANNVDLSSREVVMAPPTSREVPMAPLAPMIPSGQFVIPPTPTASFEPVTDTSAIETTLESTTDMFADFTTPASPFEEAIFDTAEEDFEMERLGRKNELMRDINGLENQDKRWQSSMEQLVKNTEDYAFKGARVSSPVKAVKVMPSRAGSTQMEASRTEPIQEHQRAESGEDSAFEGARVDSPLKTVNVVPVRVEPTEVEPVQSMPIQVEPVLEESTTTPSTLVEGSSHMGSVREKMDQLKQKYPSRYAQYLADKEGFGMRPSSSASSSSYEDAFTPVSLMENDLSMEDAEVVAPVISVRPKKNRRTFQPEIIKSFQKFSGKRIAFSDDHMFSRKIDGADIRRQQQRLRQVTLGGPTTPSYVNKARNFLEMVNTKKNRSHGLKNNGVEPQLDSSAMVANGDVAGCSKGKVPIWLTFENSVGSELIDSTFAEDWDACRQMCENESCNSFTFYDDQQCMVNTEDEGVNLRPPAMGPFTAKTTLKFCYPDTVAPFHGCANFVAFRDYSLTVQPQELFEGLPPGYEGLKLCVELCVLSTEYSCRSASFEMLDGVCKLHAVDSISAPTKFEPSHVQHQLYFENGCTSQPELSPIDRSFVSIERVPTKDASSPKALQIKPIKLKKLKLHRNRKHSGFMGL